MKGGQGVHEFHTSRSVDDEEAVPDLSDAGTGAMADVVVEDIAKVGRARDG